MYARVVATKLSHGGGDGRLAGARVDPRIVQRGHQPALPALRDPVVEQGLDRSPHHDPAQDHEALADGADRPGGLTGVEHLREREQPEQQADPDQQGELAGPPLTKAAPVEALELVGEVPAVAVRDVGRGAGLGEPDHDPQPAVRDHVLGRVDQVLDQVGVEIALAKRRGIAVVEQLLRGADPDVDAGMTILEPVARIGAHPTSMPDPVDAWASPGRDEAVTWTW